MTDLVQSQYVEALCSEMAQRLLRMSDTQQNTEDLDQEVIVCSTSCNTRVLVCGGFMFCDSLYAYRVKQQNIEDLDEEVITFFSKSCTH